MSPYREDYYIDWSKYNYQLVLDDADDSVVVGTAGNGFYLGSGVVLDQLQDWTIRVPLRRQGDSLGVTVTNKVGRFEIKFCEVMGLVNRTRGIRVS